MSYCICVVTIGGFVMGTALGWTSPAGPILTNVQYAFHVTDENMSWIAAFLPLGALIGCPVMAVVVDKFGRKQLMILLTIPTFVGWAMIIWVQSVSHAYISGFDFNYNTRLKFVIIFKGGMDLCWQASHWVR